MKDQPKFDAIYALQCGKLFNPDIPMPENGRIFIANVDVDKFKITTEQVDGGAISLQGQLHFVPDMIDAFKEAFSGELDILRKNYSTVEVEFGLVQWYQ